MISKSSPNQVCRFWQAGNCVKGDQCNWVHPGVATAGSVAMEQQQQQQAGFSNGRPSSSSSRQSGSPGSFSGSKRASSGRTGEPQQQNGSGRERWGRPRTATYVRGSQSSRTKPQLKPCKYWLDGDCRKGENCNYLHAHTTATDIEMITALKGHTKAVRSISLFAESNHLYTGSQDGSVKIWDCTTAQCIGEENMGDDMGSILIESGTLFVGLNGVIKMVNISERRQGDISGFAGSISTMKFLLGYLVAGCKDGTILVWQFNSSNGVFEPFQALKGHTGTITALETVGTNFVFSASQDATMRVWDLPSGSHLQTITDHSDVVTGLLSWNGHVLSCSLDGTVKVWAIEGALLKLTYTHHQNGDEASASSGDTRKGVLSICGTADPAGKPVLLVAYLDSLVRLFELPSFTERGALFARDDVRALHVAPSAGIIFTGDISGEVKVWRWKPTAEVN